MKTKVFVIIFAVILVICSITALCMYNFENNSQTVVIESDGKVIRIISLNEVSSPYSIDIEYNGRHNIVAVDKNYISVTDADCPDNVCVKHGELKNKFSPIVCLPNRLIIKYSDKNEEIDVFTR